MTPFTGPENEGNTAPEEAGAIRGTGYQLDIRQMSVKYTERI